MDLLAAITAMLNVSCSHSYLLGSIRAGSRMAGLSSPYHGAASGSDVQRGMKGTIGFLGHLAGYYSDGEASSDKSLASERGATKQQRRRTRALFPKGVSTCRWASSLDNYAQEIDGTCWS